MLHIGFPSIEYLPITSPLYMMDVIIVFPVAKIPLNEACSGGDVCEDANAECNRGYCRCSNGFFESNRRCGNYILLMNCQQNILE